MNIYSKYKRPSCDENFQTLTGTYIIGLSSGELSISDKTLICKFCLVQ